MQKDQAQLNFKQYSSLELSTRDKVIKALRQRNQDKQDILWVASEKIHGSNFSIHFNDKFARYGRRTDFICKQIPIPCENQGSFFTESFFDARNLVTKFHNNLTKIFQNIKKIYPDLLKVSIYGQYFGGNWPANHPQGIQKGPKSVQKGVNYTPNHEFMAFDILIHTAKEEHIWIDVLDIPKILGQLMMSVPVYCKGTFDQTFDVNIRIDSTIPELLGFNKLEKNIIQGMVIRPNSTLRNKDGDRVIIKKKNDDFAEKVEPTVKGPKEKKEKKIDPELVPYIEELSKYVNFNRIDSVVSKFPDLKDRNKLKQLVLADAITDAQKDEFKFPEKEQTKKAVTKELDLIVMKEINSYFVKH